MKLDTRYGFAALAALTAFVMAGGMQATAQAVRAEEAARAGSETSIPFVNKGGVRDWQAIDDSTLYVQDLRRSWYLVKLATPCTDLAFATNIGFETKGVDTLDRFGTVIAGGQRCPISSFVGSGPPPAKGKK